MPSSPMSDLPREFTLLPSIAISQCGPSRTAAKAAWRLLWLIEVGSSWSAWTVPVPRWFCFQPHPFSLPNSGSSGIQPITEHSQGNSQEHKAFGCISPVCCCWVWCGAGHGVGTVLFCCRTGHSCKAAFQPVALDTSFFLVWLLKKKSIILWTVQNFSTGKRK